MLKLKEARSSQCKTKRLQCGFGLMVETKLGRTQQCPDEMFDGCSSPIESRGQVVEHRGDLLRPWVSGKHRTRCLLNHLYVVIDRLQMSDETRTTCVEVIVVDTRVITEP